ncbi:radical SAM protein, partial [Myxococcota bacterium]|nr:radical SAM protein [Myxococcota bacterium]
RALGAARKALRALRATLPGSGPVYAHVGVTHRCDLTCSMCAIWKEGDRSTELTVDGHARVADALREAGVLVVSLGGGEPFVRRDLAGIVAAYARRGLDVRVLTNGQQVTPSRAAELADAGLGGASVSLDSTDPGLFDEICERKGAFDRALVAMDAFRRSLPPPRGPLVMNVVVSARNLHELPDLVDFADARGFLASFLPVELPARAGRDNKFIRDPGDMAVRPERHADVRAAFDRLVRLRAAGRPVFNSTRYLETTRDYLLGAPAPPRCDAGGLYLSVSPEGRLTPCHVGPSLGPAGDGDLVARLAAAARDAGPPRAQPWCGDGCVRACWHEVSYAFRDPGTFVETALGHTRRALAQFPGAPR